MAKLKCWKKTPGKRRWWKEKPKYREIEVLPTVKGYGVFLNHMCNMKKNNFKSKPQALKRAKEYMKKHDKCRI